MKTSEEWFKIWLHRKETECFTGDEMIGLMKEIQKDALTEAANIVNDARSGEETDLRCIRDRIKGFRDEIK